MERVLACDVGGTKTNVAIYSMAGTDLQLLRLESFRSREHGSLETLLSRFIDGESRPLTAAGFGVAGPVSDGRVRTTNLPWQVDARRLAGILSLDRVSLVNDVEAHAWSILRLGAADRVTLQSGTPGSGNLAVVAAGTGLGFSALVRGDGPIRSLASEGGHADFSPGDDIEVELLRWLRRRFGHVSAERVISGPGLVHVHEFLRSREPGADPGRSGIPDPAGDPAASVARAALEGSDALAERAVLGFLGAFGAEAGNWALRTLATGGVWLGGGVARKLLVGPAGTSDAWRSRARDAFLGRFRDKGRLGPLVASVPVHVIVNETAPLIGAAHVALAGAGRSG